MAKRRVILALVVCFSIAAFAVQTLSQARGSNPPKPPDLERLQNMTEQERKRYFEKMRTQRELERAQKKRELAKERAQKERELAKEGRGQLISIQQRRKNSRKKIAEITKELLREKAALGATEEQWKLIKPKLEDRKSVV